MLAFPAALRRSLRVLGALLMAAGLCVGVAGAAAGAEDGPVVTIVEVEGVLDRPVATFLTEVLAEADASGTEVVVLRLDTPGGLGVSGVRLAEAVAASPVPVAVWVGPPGAVAAGAGAVLAEAAHVVALSPGSTLGPAGPADLRRGTPTGEAVTVSTEGLAVAAEPPGGATVMREADVVEAGVADVVAPRLEDVLSELDGRAVTVGGAPRTLDVDPTAASVRFENLGLWRQLLHGLTNPSLAYVLLLGGALALGFELFQPGFGVAGVSGVVLLAAGLYGVAVLPVAWWALALLLVGLALLAVDLAIAGLGLPTGAGTLALAAGSVFLFPGPGQLGMPVWVAAVGVVSAVVFFVPVMTVVLRAQGGQAMAGAERVIGKEGVVRSMLNPEGHVFIDGALWRARAPDDAGKVRTGTTVRVTGLNDRLTLDVEVVDAPREAAR